MALWGKNDQANNSPKFVPAQKKLKANTANQTALFGNTTFGVVALNPAETKAQKGGPAHAGWQLRKEGTGGRAGRVQYETLVAMSSIVSDAADDAIAPDNTITITTAPPARTVTAPAATTFPVVAAIEGGGTLSYQWQISTGGAYSNLTDAGVYTGVTTATLSISNSTGLNGNRYRVIVSEAAGNAKAVTTTGVLLTVA